MFKVLNKSFGDLLPKSSSMKSFIRHKPKKYALKTDLFSFKSDDIRREEEILFDKTYHKILSQISETTEKDRQLSRANEWLRNCIEYNVPKGKRNRGLMTVISYHLLATNDDKTPHNMECVRALGWALELFQAYFLILDDIMDESVTRRGQSCWYRLPSVGMIACNDSTLIQSAVFRLIQLYFKDRPFYGQIVDLFHEVFRKTAYGQCLDMLSVPDFTHFTHENYAAIVKYKTSLYTFVLPVRLAMYLTDYKSPKDHEIVEQILTKIGHLFQAQDDYLDCFGQSDITGKIGTDIEDGKCCWNIITALDVCNDSQRELLYKHYGKRDMKSVEQIKQIYEELSLQQLFDVFERSAFDEILDMIEDFEHQMMVPIALFNEPLAQVYRRKK